MSRFDSQTIIVTGGAGGIDVAICHRFAEEGGHVVIVDTAASQSEAQVRDLVTERLSGEFSPLDLTDAAAIHRFVTELSGRRRIDLRCNMYNCPLRKRVFGAI